MAGTATELATAYLSLVPSMRGAQGQIAKELGGVDTTTAGRNMGQKMGGGLLSSLRKFIAPVAALFAGQAIASFAGRAVESFSSLEDATGAAGVVFGSNMDQIIAQSKTAASELGLSESQVIDAANTFGTYGKAAGLSGKDLAAFATEQTALAADMASFKGTSPEQAIEAIGAALRGETEPIRAYGVMLDDASLKAEAMRQGLISTTKDALTPQQKTLAAQALILKQTSDAQGDFARTQDSTANVAKTASADFENLSAKIGGVLAPAFTAVRLVAIDVMAAFSTLVDQAGPGIATFAAGVGPALETAVTALGAIATEVGAFASAVGAQLQPVLAVVAPLLADLAARAGVVAAVVGGVLLAGFRQLPAVLGGIVAVGAAVTGWLQQNQAAAQVLAGIITAVLLPALVRKGVAATVAGAQSVAAWAASSTASARAAAAYVLSSLRIVASWVAMGAAAVVSGAQTAYVWLLYQLDSARAAAAHALAAARVVAGWVAMGVAAAASAVRTAAAWTVGVVTAAASGVAAFVVAAARVVAGWAVMAAGAIAQAAVMAGAAARVVAGWVLMGVQSLIQAARMAAAWFIALGPIGWVAAAVIGLVALVIANWSKVSAFTSRLWSALTAFVVSAVTRLRAGVTGSFTLMRSVLTGIVNGIRGAVVGAWNFIVGSITNAVGRIRGSVVNGFNTARSTVQSTMNAARGIVSSVWNGIVGTVQSTVGRVVSTISGIRGRIMGVLAGAGGWLRTVGTNIIQGLVNGVLSMGNAIREAVRSVIGNVVDFAKGILGIASPSKVFYEIGEWTGEGYENAVLDKAKDTQAAMAALVRPPRAGSFDTAAIMAQWARTAPAPDPVGDVYVQNPFTGEYLLARSAQVADGRITAADRDAGRRRPGRG